MRSASRMIYVIQLRPQPGQNNSPGHIRPIGEGIPPPPLGGHGRTAGGDHVRTVDENTPSSRKRKLKIYRDSGGKYEV